MKLRVALLLAACAAGCEHTNKSADQPASSSPPAGTNAPTPPSPTSDMKPEPVAKAPGMAAPTPGPAPAPAADEVRPPTAADLAEYTKDIAGSGKLMATLDTSQGTIHCALFADKAPATVANFVGLATGKKAWTDPASHEVQKGKPFFDGLTFHRVIPDFMIQGGDPLGLGYGGPGYYFDDEIDRSLPMGPGALAMANAGVRGGHGTNGSQFFIMEGARPDLVGHHTVFGQCKELDVVKKITSVPTGAQDKPTTPVTINKVTISKS
jgi:peptidyl-prolyl cis-trans isomerase A (cyclophilin A)